MLTFDSHGDQLRDIPMKCSLCASTTTELLELGGGFFAGQWLIP